MFSKSKMGLLQAIIPPRRIALSGGGMKGIAHVGALEVLEERGLLKGIREYIGTSAGALMAFCVAIGYSVAELRTLCLGFDFTLMQTLEPETMLDMPSTFGFDSGENLDRLLRALLKARGLSPNLTFGELDTGPALRIFASDIETCQPKEFSAAKTPGAELRLAVAASMAIPFYFTPVRDPETGNRLVDGGLIAHFPFHHLTDAERLETIGFAFSHEHKVAGNQVQTIMTYILQLYYSVYHHQNERLYEGWRHRILFINCGGFPSLQFDSTAAQKEALINTGRDGAEEFLGRKGPRPARRYSIP